MTKLELKFIGVDSWNRKVYEDINTNRLYKDTDCINNEMTIYSICTTNSFDGEPNIPLEYISSGNFEIKEV